MFIIILSITSLAPQKTDAAGLFSIFANKTEAKTIAFTHNSQTLPILNPTISPTRKNKLADASNDIDNNALIAQTGPSGTEADIADAPVSDTISVYIVRSGDTLQSIAKMFNVSVNTIIWANDLTKNTKPKPGDTYIILPVSGISYKIKKGDTISKIAKNFNADEREIILFNGLDDGDGLVSGESIIIPNGEIKEAPKVVPKLNSSSGPKLIPGSGGPSLLGYFVRPVSGCRRTQGLHGKNGVDIGCPRGTAIFAAASGTVIVADNAGYNGGYGQYIVIQHDNGTQTLYAHLSNIFVTSGQTVNQGAQIGTVGNTGHSTGPHLHWEVRGAANPVAIDSNYGL